MTGLPIAGAPEPATPGPTSGPDALQLRQQWDRLVQENDLVLFMKGSPEAPRCGFSNRAVEALRQTGRPFRHVDVFTAGPDPWTTIRTAAEWADFPTLPQVWVKGELIGGSDIAMDMVQSGELQKMLEA